MEIILFGGTYCETTIKKFLYSHVGAIAVQIERGLIAKQSEEQIKKEMAELFKFQKIKIHISEAEVSDMGGNRLETRIKEGVNRKVLVKFYSYSIPFEGDSSIMKYRPTTFHGHNCKAKIDGLSDKKMIKVRFDSEENFQEQFDFNKSQSIGSLALNADEANSEIENWNNNLVTEIDRIFPLVKAEYNKTIDFNLKNNIK